MTAIPALLSRADRKRLLGRLDDLRELDALMRQPGTLARPGTSPDDIPSRRPPGRTDKEGPTP